jgi:hypothetical protein
MLKRFYSKTSLCTFDCSQINGSPTMRMGGRSTKGWRSNLLLNREIVRGNRENGVYTNLAMLVPKYAFKVWEFLGKS